MKNYFTVTVRDINGVKQFTLHKRVKHALALGVAAGGLLMAAALFSLLEMRAEVARLQDAKTAVQAQKAHLEAQSKSLNDAIDRQRDELADAKSQMDAIELAMGLEAAKHASLDFRVRRAVVSTEERAKVLEVIPSGSPVSFEGISSKFGYRTHPITHTREFHRGVDLRAKMNTPVYATADGVVEFAEGGDNKGYGKLIILDHAYGFRTLYGHLHKLGVKNGQVVKKGELIGYSGNSGLSNGPHLHYEVRFIQRTLNPYWFVKWNMGNYDEIFAKVKRVGWQPILEAIAEDASQPKTVVSRAGL
jgi:murein DD-endopeptidase MepM/ murein hydrolase activator NlpD